MSDETTPAPLNIARRARELLERVAERDYKVATAESCTGGYLASILTDIEGVSNRFDRGFVTYSPEAKCDLLSIEATVIDRCGVVSREVAEAMAHGALHRSDAQLAAAITGYAGAGSEPGLVYISVAGPGPAVRTRECHFGDVGRDAVREATVHAALDLLDEALSHG